MGQKIRVLIADDIEETRKNIITLFQFEERIEVAGEAANGEEAINLTQELRPNVILMDINMPVLDGLKATEKISILFPDIPVIIMSVQGEREYFKNAMQCGAKEYLVKPFNLEDLNNTILNTYDKEQDRRNYLKSLEDAKQNRQEPKVITVFSTKGGVGKTTIAANTAISLAKETGQKVALLDLDLQFGDISVMLNISQAKTIVDLIEDIGHLNDEILEEYMIDYMKNVKVLASPPKPEYAEYIMPSHIEKIIQTLKRNYQYIVIDSVAAFSDVMLTALDNSDEIIFVSTMNLPTLKNVKLGLEIMESLHYPQEKIRIVVNRASKYFDVDIKDIEEVLEKTVNVCIPEDMKTVIPASNKGYPFMRSRGESKVSRSIKEISKMIVTGKEVKCSKRGIGRIFSKPKLNITTN